jgi:hypothetical protein
MCLSLKLINPVFLETYKENFFSFSQNGPNEVGGSIYETAAGPNYRKTHFSSYHRL